MTQGLIQITIAVAAAAAVKKMMKKTTKLMKAHGMPMIRATQMLVQTPMMLETMNPLAMVLLATMKFHQVQEVQLIKLINNHLIDESKFTIDLPNVFKRNDFDLF
jgi:hypothetical protein